MEQLFQPFFPNGFFFALHFHQLNIEKKVHIYIVHGPVVQKMNSGYSVDKSAIEWMNLIYWITWFLASTF